MEDLDATSSITFMNALGHGKFPDAMASIGAVQSIAEGSGR